MISLNNYLHNLLILFTLTFRSFVRMVFLRKMFIRTFNYFKACVFFYLKIIVVCSSLRHCMLNYEWVSNLLWLIISEI